MTPHRLTTILIAMLTLLLCAPGGKAQQFAVASFRLLPDDVSAAINPVRDLNGDDCGLIKVMASGDFAFSSPLGIARRIDKTGEIWLYLPRGTKKITIKHPQWGVMRDYRLPSRIESRLTYELDIDEPAPEQAPKVVVDTVVTTLRDTLVVTRVDTIMLRPVKKPVPLEVNTLATLAYGGKSKILTGGLLLMALKRHGAFMHISTDFSRIGPAVATCNRNGLIGSSMPFYTGATRHSAMMLNAGMAHRLSNRVAIFEGLGYSRTTIAWQLAPSEGGGYVKNSHYSVSGISFEIGTLLKFNRLTVSASVLSIRGTDWYGSAGIGYRFGK